MCTLAQIIITDFVLVALGVNGNLLKNLITGLGNLFTMLAILNLQNLSHFKEGVFMGKNKIKFTCNAVRWFDKINGNTYHSVRVTRNKDNNVLVHTLTYGYEEHYKQTALEIMLDNNWIPAKYQKELYMYERENEYPIDWNVTDGLKRDCVANGII